MILAVVMHNGHSIEVGVAAALGTALIVGAFDYGVLIAYVGMPPFVVTLAMLSFARGLRQQGIPSAGRTQLIDATAIHSLQIVPPRSIWRT